MLTRSAQERDGWSWLLLQMRPVEPGWAGRAGACRGCRTACTRDGTEHSPHCSCTPARRQTMAPPQSAVSLWPCTRRYLCCHIQGEGLSRRGQKGGCTTDLMSRRMLRQGEEGGTEEGETEVCRHEDLYDTWYRDRRPTSTKLFLLHFGLGLKDQGGRVWG